MPPACARVSTSDATTDAHSSILHRGQRALLGAGLGLFVHVPSTAPAWQVTLNGSATQTLDQANVVAVDAMSDVVAAGSTQNGGDTFQDFTVVKVAGTTGALLWRQEVRGSSPNTVDTARAAAVTAGGDVIAAGLTSRTDTIRDFTVVKLRGSDGAPVWRRDLNSLPEASSEARVVVVDGAGDILAAGAMGDAGFTVVKLAGTDGGEIWRVAVTAPTGSASGGVESLAVDAAGNVVVGGSLPQSPTLAPDFAVVTLASADGTELWRGTVASAGGGRVYAVGIDGGGDVSGAGVTDQGFTVVKFAASTGAARWRYSAGGGEARALAVDRSGDILVAGVLVAQDIPTVVKLAGTTGAERWRAAACDPAQRAVAFALAVNARGQVIGGGVTRGSPTHFAVFALAGADGAEQWCRTVSGSANGENRAFAVALDGAGEPIGAGVTANVGTGEGDLTVLKFAAGDGAELWRAVVDGRLNFSEDRALAVALDAAGNVIAAGETENAETARDFAVAKFAGLSGSARWHREISGTAGGSIDRALAVAADGVGDVVTAGVTENDGSGSDFTVIKFAASNGREEWRRIIDGTARAFDAATAVVVDAARDVLAVGVTANLESAQDFTVAKLAGADGEERWRTVIRGSAGGADLATAVALDAEGHVLAAGFTENTGTGVDFTVVKLSSTDGAALWQRDLDGCVPGSRDEAFAVAVDGTGDVLAAGFTNGTAGGRGTDFTVVKLAGGNGDEVWRAVIDASPERIGMANVLALDPDGDVVAAGSLESARNQLDFVVVKLARNDGHELWRRAIGAPGINQAFGVAADRCGNIVAAGMTTSATGSTRFTVLKVAGDDGSELWQRDWDGEALALGIDAVNDVVTAGFTFGLDTGPDFAVIKLRGVDGGLADEPTRTPTQVPSATPIATATSTRPVVCDVCDGRSCVLSDGNAGNCVVQPNGGCECLFEITPTASPSPSPPPATPTVTTLPSPTLAPTSTSTPSPTPTVRAATTQAPLAHGDGGCTVAPRADRAGCSCVLLVALALGGLRATTGRPRGRSRRKPRHGGS